jgi:hypothetical protein
MNDTVGSPFVHSKMLLMAQDEILSNLSSLEEYVSNRVPIMFDNSCFGIRSDKYLSWQFIKENGTPKFIIVIAGQVIE